MSGLVEIWIETSFNWRTDLFRLYVGKDLYVYEHPVHHHGIFEYGELVVW